jgi:CopG family nickel-responsive transcriptional regulator
MAIISVSLSEPLLKEIDQIKDEMGFSGRSEVLRTSARLLISENKEKSNLEGELNSVLILIHDQKYEDQVTEIKHDFEDIINTQIHSHLQDEKCLELFILDGDSQRMAQLSKKFQSSRMDYVKLIIVQ